MKAEERVEWWVWGVGWIIYNQTTICKGTESENWFEFGWSAAIREPSICIHARINKFNAIQKWKHIRAGAEQVVLFCVRVSAAYTAHSPTRHIGMPLMSRTITSTKALVSWICWPRMGDGYFSMTGCLSLYLCLLMCSRCIWPLCEFIERGKHFLIMALFHWKWIMELVTVTVTEIGHTIHLFHIFPFFTEIVVACDCTRDIMTSDGESRNTYKISSAIGSAIGNRKPMR